MTITHPVVLVDEALGNSIWNRVLRSVEKLGYRIVYRIPTVTLTETIERSQPDVLLIGWAAESLATIRQLKSDEFHSRLPVIVIAEEMGLETVADAIDAGAEDCLRSGTPDSLLRARIRTAVRSKYFYDNIIRVASEESMRDGLTGLWNHAHFQDLLRVDLARSSRSGSTTGLLLVDIDHFKSINDRYGHPAGDEAIRQTVAALKSCVRSGDILARYGGEEFAVILPEADRADALAVAERIRHTVEHRDFRPCAGVKLSCTVSVGTAIAPFDSAHAADLIMAADVALYQAKRTGRNRVESVRWVPFEFLGDPSVDWVGVGGDWNAWAPERGTLLPSAETRNIARWESALLLPTGKNRYKFKLRETGESRANWTPDLGNPEFEPDGFGGINSIKVVEPYALAA